MSQSGGGGATAYLVWTAVSSVVDQVMARLTAAALSDQTEKRMFVSTQDCLWCLSAALRKSEAFFWFTRARVLFF